MKPHCQSFWLPGSLTLLCLVTTSPLRAQIVPIVPDESLPKPSIVDHNKNTSVIRGGTQAGPNLFHSFREFSVPTDGSASFQEIDQGIENVISRVTGTNVSNINGLIQVLGKEGTVSEANFFLLNPNGMIFGRNAQLNIGGSFLASTASSLNFADGTSFSATNSQTIEPLLTVSLPIGLQFARPATNIQVQGAGLIVPSGKTLGLVSGDLTLVGGGLGAAGGRIELGSVTGVVTPDFAPVQVRLTPIDKGWALGYERVQNFQDIQLSQQATVTASGNGGGDIQVQGRRVTVTDNSHMNASTKGSGLGGTLAVSASEAVEISGSSTSGRLTGLFAQVNPAATGTGGNLNIETRQLLVQGGAQVSTASLGSGKAGNLTVQATESVIVSGTDDLKTSRSGLRATDGGDLTIETGRLLVRDGAQVLTSTFGQGQAGNLTVQNATVVELVGGTVAANGKFISSGLLTTAEPNSIGAGGNLKISTEKLIVRDGAQVNSTTFGVGRAGNLTVQATDVELVGTALLANGELLTNEIGLPFTSGLFAGTGVGSGGDGGTLSVKTDRLSLRDGSNLQTTTFGAGNAGNLIVQATESVELIGTAKGTQFPSSLVAVSGGIPGLGGVVEAKGRGGDLTIETGELIVQDGAAVAVSSLNPASVALGTGNLQITAQSIRLDNLAKLQAETASGDGGNIKLLVQDLLLLRRNSEISTTAGIAGTGGNGGNIAIDTPFIIAVPDEDSDITANAFEGAGGLIQIKATQVFGLERREQLTPLSDITAFSQQNPELNGIVEINTPDVDPSRGLVTLPAEVVDASELIASGCGTPGTQEQSKFIVMGRGGLPSSPSDTFSSDTVWSDLRPQTRQAQNLTSSEQATQQTLPTAGQLVEAQGWVINNKGEVVLTASAPTVTPNSPGLTSAECHGS